MKEYKFYVKLFQTVRAQNVNEAKQEIKEMMQENKKEYGNSLQSFIIEEGIEDNEPIEIEID